jgi:micrococcal nuclease
VKIRPRRRRRTSKDAIRLLLAGALLLGLVGTVATLAATRSAPGPGEETGAALVRVVDGDTIVVRLPNGRQERVRYIGIDTPELRPAVEPWAREATLYNKELLGKGPIRLRLDVQERDRFGRLLAYVWAGDVFVNERLVADGYARAATYPPNVAYTEVFVEAERRARAEARGLWGAGSEDD